MVAVMHEETILVTTETQVAAARAVARRMAAGLGFDVQRTAEIETAVAELAGNLVAHRAIRGRLNLKPIGEAETLGLEVRADDQGPGIRDLNNALRDWQSTAGTLGIGLAGAKRLMDEFVIESAWGSGTHITAKKWLRRGAVRTMDFSVYLRPKPGEEVSGDAYFIKRFPSAVLAGMVDALGHGREAHETAHIARDLLVSRAAGSLEELMRACHDGLRHTRGAAVALCRVDESRHTLEHLSVGNVETRVYGSPVPVRPFCFHGTLGMVSEHFHAVEYPFQPGAAIVMFSDGVSGRFDLALHELAKTPQEISWLIFSRHARETDDATVLVGR